MRVRLLKYVVSALLVADGLVLPVWRGRTASRLMVATRPADDWGISQVEALRNDSEWRWVFEKLDGFSDSAIYFMSKLCLGEVFGATRKENNLIMSFYNMIHRASVPTTKVFTILWDDPDEPPSTYVISSEKAFTQLLRTTSMRGLTCLDADGILAGATVLEWQYIDDGGTYQAISQQSTIKNLGGRLKHRDEGIEMRVADLRCSALALCHVVTPRYASCKRSGVGQVPVCCYIQPRDGHSQDSCQLIDTGQDSCELIDNKTAP
ncbi:hypothetical protein JKP88DRAFT_242090 [Tribonema minus]|uniref:Uncharacterized protein n=1 Tax=Tribonema minus TaxID=303371 RepID=A0A836C8V6_9STRA|nr:hypothetical protein JKP88DRAFT_242090 [Tribonema minus]